MDPTSAAISTVSVRLIMCAWAVTAPSCSGFTIGQIVRNYAKRTRSKKADESLSNAIEALAASFLGSS
jgi:hypothetical protein